MTSWGVGGGSEGEGGGNEGERGGGVCNVVPRVTNFCVWDKQNHQNPPPQAQLCAYCYGYKRCTVL